MRRLQGQGNKGKGQRTKKIVFNAEAQEEQEEQEAQEEQEEQETLRRRGKNVIAKKLNDFNDITI